MNLSVDVNVHQFAVVLDWEYDLFLWLSVISIGTRGTGCFWYQHNNEGTCA